MSIRAMFADADALRSDSFFYSWLAVFGAGTLCGVLAARFSCAVMDEPLLALCGSVCPDGRLAAWPLFFSTASFFLVTVLLSQLPGSRFFIAVLTWVKAFSTAYVFGVLYVLHQQAGLHAAVLSVALHAMLLLPAFYMFSCQCTAAKGRVLSWPAVLALVYLLLAVWLETALFARF